MGLRIKKDKGSILLYDTSDYIGSISLKNLYQTITGKKYSERKPQKVEIPNIDDDEFTAFEEYKNQNGRN